MGRSGDGKRNPLLGWPYHQTKTKDGIITPFSQSTFHIKDDQVAAINLSCHKELDELLGLCEMTK